jgi:cytochrome c-type biogenesis protein CcmE
MTRKQRRLSFIFAALICLGGAVGLISYALRDSFAYFASPTDIQTGKAKQDQRLRLGGLVAKDSFKKEGLTVTFNVTDGNATIKAIYTGVLPDLFREGQGVVLEGKMAGEIFKADTVLAKHDEKYVPKEVMESLKAQGLWKEGGK